MTSSRDLRRGFYDKAPAPPPPGVATSGAPKAIVVFDYVKKASSNQVSLDRNQIVSVIEAKPGSDWWKVQDGIGRRGHYPAHYLKMI